MTISSSKILFLADDFSKGGAARVVEGLISGLSSEFSPVLFCLDALGERGEFLRRRGVQVACLDRTPGTDYRLILRLAGLIRRENIRLVHAHQHTAYFYGTLAAFLNANVKVIFTEHGRHYPDVRKPLKVFVNKLLLFRTAVVTAVSEAVKQSLITYEGIPTERIRILINGIDAEAFGPSFDHRAIRRELGVEPSDLLLGMVARLGEEKDHATLLEAMVLVSAQLPSARLLIVGEGPKRKELERLTLSLGLQGRVIFTGKREDVPQLASVLDVAVLSSFYEGTSITILEAMAAGKAVVASRVGGNSQVVSEGQSGLLFEQGDERELAEKIILLLQNEQLRKQMGRRGREILEQRFSGRRMVEEYEQLYRQVLNYG